MTVNTPFSTRPHTVSQTESSYFVAVEEFSLYERGVALIDFGLDDDDDDENVLDPTNQSQIELHSLLFLYGVCNVQSQDASQPP